MNNPVSLKIHEWMAVTAIITMMCVLTAFALFKKSWGASASQPSSSVFSQNRIEAVVKGAVVHPGVYSLPKEMSLKELLDIAQLAPEADLRRYNLDRTVQQGRVINVPKRALIKVHVSGAVESEKTLILPQGTRLEELVGKIVLSEDAHVEVLKKKRKLKDGEVITIPKKGSPAAEAGVGRRKFVKNKAENAEANIEMSRRDVTPAK